VAEDVVMNDQHAGELDLRLLISKLWKGRWWILFVTLLSIGICLVVAIRTERVYRAQTIAAIASQEGAGIPQALGQLGGLAALAGLSLGSSGGIEETLAVIRSREFSERFIVAHDLMPVLFRNRWDSSSRKWKGDAESQPTLVEAYREFNRRVRFVSVDKKTGLVSLGIVWPDPVAAAGLANGMVEQINEEMRSRAILQAEAAVKYLQKELEQTSAIDTRQAINRLLESQINQRMYANVTKQFALRVVDRALPPDVKTPIRPRTRVLLALGALLGGFAGCLIVLGMEAIRAGRVPASR
jgi:uncharacterized protein involved in exopolysaccharide biosynthesis